MMDCVKRYITCYETNKFINGAVYVNNIIYKKFNKIEELNSFKCKKYKEIIDNVFISENDMFDISKYMPNYHDFSYLMDYTDVEIDDQVYVYDNKDNIYLVKVVNIETISRPAGIYTMREWDISDSYILDYKKCDIYYDNHEVTMIHTSDNKSYIWEDFNYQQSFLDETHKNHLNA